MSKFDLENKKILVTGACGTVGAKLIDELLKDKYKSGYIVGIDNNESELFYLTQKYAGHSNLNLKLCDVRDKSALEKASVEVDVIFHLAAYKHVAMCETSPMEAIQTNILATQNIISAATACSVKRVIFASTDKAVNPTNVMGVSKLMSEKLITAANLNHTHTSPIFSSTRFGNVLGSNGSVLPVFLSQILRDRKLKLTDDNMTRFIMTNKEAVKLLIDSAKIAQGGEVFVTKMPTIRIVDLAHVVIEIAATKAGFDPRDIEIKNIGKKPGEKLFEELMSEEEMTRAHELHKYFVVLPPFRDMYQNISYEYKNLKSKTVSNSYKSNQEAFMTRQELSNFLTENDLVKIK